MAVLDEYVEEARPCIVMEQACAITALAAKATAAALRAAELEVAIGELPVNGALRVQAIERALAHALKLLDHEHNLLAHASGDCDCGWQLARNSMPGATTPHLPELKA